jgi:glutaredoxin
MTPDPPVAQTPAQPPAEHTISLLSRPGCHLCDEAREVVARVAGELGVAWTERDVTASAQDMRQYADMIPVIFVDGVQHDFWRVDEPRLRKALGH